MDAHAVSLSAWAWQLLCDMLSAQGSRDGVGTPPGTGRWDAQIFPQILCKLLRGSGTPIFKVPNCRRKICGKFAKSLRVNLRTKNRTKNQFEKSTSLEDESQEDKKT